MYNFKQHRIKPKFIIGDRKKDKVTMEYIIIQAETTKAEIADELLLSPQTVNRTIRGVANNNSVLTYIDKLADKINYKGLYDKK